MFSRATSAATRRLLTASHRPANVAAATGASASKTSVFDTRRNLNVASRPSDLVGNTPLIDLSKILVAHGVDGER